MQNGLLVVADGHEHGMVADGRAKCSSDSTPMHLLALPPDVQLAIAAHLAHEAGGLAGCDTVAAIASLSCASRACRSLVTEARAWEQAGCALGLASPLHERAFPLWEGPSSSGTTAAAQPVEPAAQLQEAEALEAEASEAAAASEATAAAAAAAAAADEASASSSGGTVRLPKLCRAACLAHRLCRTSAAEPCEGMHVSLLPRGGGWARELYEALGPLGLCAVSDAADLAEGLALPSVPFVIVPCDARCAAAAFFDRSTDGGPLCTLPCARSCCDAPAAVGCFHCRKHGGAGARQLVARCAAQLQLRSGIHAPGGGGGGGGPRRIIFAAASAEVREAYRKALLGLASAPRKQLRGVVSTACPVDSRQ